MRYEEEVVREEEYRGYKIKLVRDLFAGSPRKDRDNLGTFVTWSRNWSTPDNHEHYSQSGFLAWLSGMYLDDLERADRIDDKWEPSWDGYYFKWKGLWRIIDSFEELQFEEINKTYVILGVNYRDRDDGCYVDYEPDSTCDGFIYCERSGLIKETGYNKGTLFSVDTKRKVKLGDYVKVEKEGMLPEWRGNWGKVIRRGRDGSVWVDHECFQQTKSLLHTWVYAQSNVVEVMSNRAVELLAAEVKEYSTWCEGNVVGKVISRRGEELDSCWGYYPDDSDEYGSVMEEARNWIDADIEERIEKKNWRTRRGSMTLATGKNDTLSVAVDASL